MSSSFPSALTILESMAGYSQLVAKAEAPSANAPIRIAVIDPAYAANSYPTTLPKVTFEGEETMSEKRYIVIDRGYRPGPSDRVVMLPAGHTYVIAGVITPAEGAPIFDEAWGADTLMSTASSTYTSSLTGGTSPTASINVSAGTYLELTYGANMQVNSAGINGACLSWQLSGASGTFEGGDAEKMETGSTEWVPGERSRIWGPTNTAGTHTLGLRYRIVGTPTPAEYKIQHVRIRAMRG